MAGTTPVTTSREPSYHICKDADEDSAPSGRTYKYWRFALHQFPFVGTTFLYLDSKAEFPINFYIQMESNQDSAALALQVQAFVASIEELTRQN